MEFYSTIAAHYDHIFPLAKPQLDFTAGHFEAGTSLLDVGCATGALAVELARGGRRVTGFDLDPRMVELAKKRAVAAGVVANMAVGNMLDPLPGGSRDGVLCYGNTLVHLKPGDARRFLDSCPGALVTGGKLAIQILNYDRVLDREVKALPTIDNDVIRFERRYDLHGEDELTFETSLTLKSSGEVVNNAIPLYPLRPDRLEEMLRDAGFARVERFGNFKGEPFTDSSYPLIVVATRA